MVKPVAVVTGGNRGLGLAACRELAGRGFEVVLTARTMAHAAQAAEGLGAEGLEVWPEALDVTSDPSVEGFFQRLQARFGRVDVLINNAGAIFEASAPGLEVEADTVLKGLDTNAVGAWRVARRALPMMNAQGFGRVVNVSSGMGGLTEMGGGFPAYRMSKAALNAATRVLHAEARRNVKVNSVCPGWVRTQMGGDGAPRSVEEGVAGIIWAATLADDGPSGGFFRDGAPIAW